MLVGLCRWIHPASGHRCVLFLVLLVFSHVAHFRYVANFRFLTLIIITSQEMLKEERERLRAELAGLSPRGSESLEMMKERSDTLRSAREERRQGLADQKLVEHFRLNNPDLREVCIAELKLYQKLVEQVNISDLTDM